MMLPQISSIPAIIPLAKIFMLENRAASIAQELNRRQYTIMGKRLPKNFQDASITDSSNAINKNIMDTLKKETTSLSGQNHLVEEYLNNDSISILCETLYDFFDFSADIEEPVTKIIIQINEVYMLHASFLKHLKCERPALYPLISLIINVIDTYMHVTTTPDIYSHIEDDFLMNEHDYADNDEMLSEMKDRKADALAEKQEYQKYITHLKCKPEKALKKIQTLHKRLAHLMDYDENVFVLTAIHMIKEYSHPEPIEKYISESDWDDNCHTIMDFFYLIWNSDSPSSWHIEEFLSGSGELSAPQITLAIKDKKGLDAVRRTVRQMLLFQTLMAAGDQIWNR